MTTTPCRTSLRSAALGVAGLVLAAASLTACGGDDDSSEASTSASPSASGSPSDSASPEESTSPPASEDASGGGGASAEFCGIYGNLFKDVTAALGASGGSDFSQVSPKLKDYAAQLEEAGIPDDAPDDAKQGFQASLDAINALPDNPTQQDLLAAGQGASAEDQAAATAFGQYVISSCPDLVPALPTPAS